MLWAMETKLRSKTRKCTVCSEVQELAGVGWSVGSIGRLRGTGGRRRVGGEMLGAWTENIPRRIQI